MALLRHKVIVGINGGYWSIEEKKFGSYHRATKFTTDEQLKQLTEADLEEIAKIMIFEIKMLYAEAE
jgi:hypothetical protein